MAALTILRAGMLTTVQDLGRWGYQHRGVGVAGPMDTYSHRLANRRAGNPDTAAALEATVIGPDLRFDADVVCATAGADFVVHVGDAVVAAGHAFDVPAGATVRFGTRTSGARVTIAVRGGLDVPMAFGSRSTSMVSRMGPFGGRALKTGDVVPIGSAQVAGSLPAGRDLPRPSGGARLRVLIGPHDAMFTSAGLEALFGSRFVISSQSNRMGYRLAGVPLQHVRAADILSDATPMGSLQVPASGDPILLMADRPTTGGYPRVATVISADLPLAGQLAPGDWIEFAECTRAAAIDALRIQEAALLGIGG
jgi:antagonist of KipI